MNAEPKKLSQWARMTPEQRARERKRKREWADRNAAKNPEKAKANNRARQRKFAKAHPERVAKSHAEWVRKNPDKCCSYARKSYRACRERRIEWAADYQRRHPEQARARKKKYDQRSRQELLPSYTSKLISDALGIPRSAVSVELIELQRAHTLLFRAIRESRKQTQPTT